ncbi:MAG: DNA-binding protein [Candidatus Electrothrix sp. AR1]|nr:DNA-binding protein [Candidatus Electrothrix sp. AR1]
MSAVGVLFAFSGVYLFDEEGRYVVKEHREQSAARSVKKETSGQEENRFSCRGKTRCSEMRSCAEATFYLQNCPGVKIDGNRDGVPCERQWCK